MKRKGLETIYKKTLKDIFSTLKVKVVKLLKETFFNQKYFQRNVKSSPLRALQRAVELDRRPGERRSAAS